MNRDALIAWAAQQGWKMDRFGHLQKEFPNGTHRLKLSRIAARYEVKSQHRWVRLRSGYYKDLQLTADGKLAGITR